MRNISLLLLLLLFHAGKVRAQVFPPQGAQLNFTEVMFEFDNNQPAGKFVVQVIEDKEGSDFNKPLIEQTDSATSTCIANLSFGAKYIWRYGAVQKDGYTTWSAPFQFQIRPLTEGEMNHTHLKILQGDSGRMGKGIMMIDFLRVACDFEGNIIWFLPLEHYGPSVLLNDLRLNKRGLITFLDNQRAQECDLSGNVKWQYPGTMMAAHAYSGITYHHDFQHLPNGNYMLLCNEKRWTKLPASIDMNALLHQWPVVTFERDSIKNYAINNDLKIRSISGGPHQIEIEYGEILEIDKDGQIVWKWDSEKYFNETGILMTGNKTKTAGIENDPHLNAFCVDENNRFVYASMRNIDLVLKIDKQTGSVVNSWGADRIESDTRNGDVFFRKQHGVILTGDKNIMVFDNEDSADAKNSRIVIFTNPEGDDSSSIVWSYNCIFDSLSGVSPRGGNVDVLPNGDYLVCMGGIPRIFGITPDKKIVWSAILRKDNPSSKIFFRPYRAHYVSSLYPCYYSVSLNKEFLNHRDKTFQVKIFNKGSEDDSYIIQVTFALQHKQVLNTHIVKAGSSAVFEIPCSGNLTDGEHVFINISSNTNPDFKRNKMLVYEN